MRLLNDAGRAGLIQREPCEVCGSPEVDAHHEDYDQPLRVRWLCRRHHWQEHRPTDAVRPVTFATSLDSEEARILRAHCDELGIAAHALLRELTQDYMRASGLLPEEG